MTREDTAQKVQSVFINHFDIAPDKFDWNQSLEALNEDFKILSYLVFLEQLIKNDFETEVPIIENISTAFHTPNDVLALIVNEL